MLIIFWHVHSFILLLSSCQIVNASLSVVGVGFCKILKMQWLTRPTISSLRLGCYVKSSLRLFKFISRWAKEMLKCMNFVLKLFVIGANCILWFMQVCSTASQTEVSCCSRQSLPSHLWQLSALCVHSWLISLDHLSAFLSSYAAAPSSMSSQVRPLICQYGADW